MRSFLRLRELCFSDDIGGKGAGWLAYFCIGLISPGHRHDGDWGMLVW